MNEWNDSLRGDYLWSSVNFGEAVTEVMTPLTWSVIQFTLDDWVFLPGTATVGVIGGRPYLNISIFATLFYSLGRSRQDLLSYMESTLYMRLPPDMEIPRIKVSKFTLFRGLLSAVGVQLKQEIGRRRTATYVRANREWFEDIRSAMQLQTTASGLYELWDERIGTHIKEGVWCVLGSVSHSAANTLQLRRDLTGLLGAADANVLIANLSTEDAVLESLGPLHALQKLARGELSREAYLANYGHRGPQEFELSVPRPAEDQDWLERELERIRRVPVDVEKLRVRQQRSFEAAWRRLQALPSEKVKRLERRIGESARRARLRERARSAYVRDRWAIRLFALRAADLTGLGDQVFFLRLDELLALLSGDQSAIQAIGPRREAYEQYRRLPPYPAVIRGVFDPFAWAADPQRPRDIFDAYKQVTTSTGGHHVVGSPGSAGVVEGIVRIIDRAENGDRLAPGEILVAVQTDIAWTLLFPRAAAVITDVGAPLSHAAIVARELGIPAVVGCGNATTVLQDGERVRVDGGRGIVEILDGG